MSKILATFVNGKLTRMKELPSNQELLDQDGLAYYREEKMLQEINEAEQRMMRLMKDNFDDLREFVLRNI